MVNINVQKKDLWLLSAIMIFLVGVAFVIAYGSGQPSVHGHDAGEVGQSVQVVGNTNINQDTATWADMDDMSITMITTGGDVLLMFSATIRTEGYPDYGSLRFNIDGNHRGTWYFEHLSNHEDQPESIHWLETSLPAGTHTFKVQWVDQGNTKLNQDGATLPRVFTAIEV